MPDLTYGPKIRHENSGDTVTVASGGTIAVEAGGKVTVKDFGTVTQITSITTGVTLNTLAGTITTVSGTLAAGAEASFVVTNSAVVATDTVAVCLGATTSGGGPFFVTVTAVAAGSFTVSITNTHASAAQDNTLAINYVVLKAAP